MTRLSMVVLSFSVGLCIGVFCYLVIESKAPSYLSTDSTACANCHVMLSSYNTWALSSHREFAKCIDCHVPHENLVRKYAVKATDGFRHAYVFTSGSYSNVIRATKNAKSIIQNNCIRCHEASLLPTPGSNADLLTQHSPRRECWSCHAEIPHGKANSISTFTGIPKTGRKAAHFILDRKEKNEKADH